MRGCFFVWFSWLVRWRGIVMVFWSMLVIVRFRNRKLYIVWSFLFYKIVRIIKEFLMIVIKDMVIMNIDVKIVFVEYDIILWRGC